MTVATKTVGAVAQDINLYDADAIRSIVSEAKDAAYNAATKHIDTHGENA